MTNENQPQTRFMAGTIWMLALRWTMRCIGLISTIILARLLTPGDFGVIAMATAVVGLLTALSTTGVDLALIREKQSDTALLNSAWTIRILQNTFIAVTLLLLRPVAATYFEEPLLNNVLVFLAGAAFIDGFRNIGIVAFRKELDFAKEFRFFVYQKLIGFTITVVLALWLRDYRALVYSLFLQGISGVVLSYLMHPYRPKLATSRMSEIWSFSQWLMISRIGMFLNEKADQILVGGRVGTEKMGLYYIGYEVGTMLVHEIVMPVRRGLFPNLSKLLDHEKQFLDASLQTISLLAMLCIPAGVGIYIVSSDLLLLLFGEKWIDAIPILKWMGVLGCVAGVTLSLDLILLVKKQAKLTAIKAWIEATALISILVLYQTTDLEKIAITRFAVALCALPIMIYMTSRALNISFNAVASLFWRPLLAAVAMLLVDDLVLGHVQLTPLFGLIAHVSLGVAVYSGSVILLWLTSGKPQGPEKMILEKFTLYLKSR